MPPVEPGKNAMGTNTATSTSVLAITAPDIWPTAFTVAWRAFSPSSRITRSTFSTTTIASSLRMPMATTMPNSDSRLSEMPNRCNPTQVPISATGTTSDGISVARQLCKNRNTTMVTSSSASTMLRTTLLTEVVMNGVVSKGTLQTTPFGKLGSSSAMRWRSPLATASALAPLVNWMLRPTDSWPLTEKPKP